jgi:spermidine/putrescine transport system permease protein
LSDKVYVGWRAQCKNQLYFLFSLPAVIWPLLFLCVPLLGVLLSSLAGGASSAVVGKYLQVMSVDHLKIIARSLLLGIGVACGCLICVYPVAYFIAITAQKWGKCLLFFLMVPLWTNFLIQLYGWQFLIERNGLINLVLQKMSLISAPIVFSNSILTVCVVMVYCYIPFMFVPLYSILSSFDKRLLEASADLGASSMQTFFRVTLPQSISGIRAGLLLTFVLGYGEFAIPVIVGGAKFMTVGSLITYYFLAVGDNALGAAFTCLSGIVLCAAAFTIYAAVNWWYKKYVGVAR